VFVEILAVLIGTILNQKVVAARFAALKEGRENTTMSGERTESKLKVIAFLDSVVTKLLKWS
jgi:hypothetical protein